MWIALIYKEFFRPLISRYFKLLIEGLHDLRMSLNGSDLVQQVGSLPFLDSSFVSKRERLGSWLLA